MRIFESKKFSEYEQISPHRSALFINEKKTQAPPIEIFNPQEMGHVLSFLVQWDLRDTKHRCRRFSSINNWEIQKNASLEARCKRTGTSLILTWSFQKEFNALKYFHRLRFSDSPPTTPAIARAGGICSAQDLVSPRNLDTCPTAPEVSQVRNMPKMPRGSYAPRGESLGPNPEIQSTLRREPRVSSHPTIRDYQTSPRHLLGTPQQQDFRIARTITPVTKFPRSNYPSYSSGDGYG